MSEALLVAATISSGLLAGVFLLYAHTVMPALARADDATFVRTFALLDRQIVNPLFLLSSFLGAPALTAAALVATWDHDDVWGWVAVALVLHLVMVGITGAMHLPRNDGLKAADDAAGDPAAARATFDERGWVRWNLVRVLLSATSLGLLAVALLEV